MTPTLVILAVLAASANATVPDRPPLSREDFDEAPPERRVAMMDARSAVPKLDPRVVRARALLDRVESLYFDDLDRIVGHTERLWRELRENGHRVSASEILEAAAAWAEELPDSRRRRFTRVASLYTTARENGLTHAETLEALKEVARSRPRGRW
jgi:hypothetical protein